MADKQTQDMITGMMALSTAPLAGLIVLVSDLQRRGLIDKAAMSDIAAAIDSNLADADRLFEGRHPSIARLRKLLDAWAM